MRALWRYENGIQAFREVEEPQIQTPDDVKIRVMYTTIGIQDLRMTREWDFYSKEGIAGYEMSGVITDLGEVAKVNGFYKGQHVTGTIAKFCGSCVYCLKGEENNCLNIEVRNGTICDYVVWDYRQLVPLTVKMPFSFGCLLESVAVVYMAAWKMQINKGDNICILGGDFNGLLMLQFARMAGAHQVTLVESKVHNRKLALSLGADHVVNPEEYTYKTELMKLSEFIGFQGVVVTTSNPEWIQTATNVVARGGTIMVTVYFDVSKNISINSVKFFAMNINITSSFLYSRKVLMQTRDIMESLQLKELISKEYHVKDVLMAFQEEQQYHYPRIGLKMGL